MVLLTRPKSLMSEKDIDDTVLYLNTQIVEWKKFLSKSSDPCNRLFADNEIAVLTNKIKVLKG